MRSTQPREPCTRRGRTPKLPVALAPLVALAALAAVALTSPRLLAQEEIGVHLLPEGTDEAAAAIDAGSLRAPIRFLSDDLLGGRGPATEGDALTRLYLSTRMEEMGLEPAFDGEWQQPFDVVGIRAEVPETWSFRIDREGAGGGPGGETVDLELWDESIAFSGVQDERAAIDGSELVFVGYGIEAPEYDWDDYGDADLAGKTLLMLNNDPEWDPELFGGEARLYYGRWTYKYESAARQGAAGAIVIHTTPSAGYGWNVVQTSWTGEQFELPAEGEPRIQVGGWTTEEATRKLLAAAGHDLDALVESARSRDFEPVPLGITTSIALANEIGRKRTANVGGVLPGSDPERAGEVVVFTAHHDHIGTADASAQLSEDGGEDRIYNGAVDNAAGTAQVLAIANAYTKLPKPPARSTLFLFVAAEEQGLLGSKYYARHPSVPAGRLAANVNFDGGNIWGRTKDITLVGSGKSEIDRVAEAVAARQGRAVKPDQHADKGYYYRSDQFSLAKIGVPALYFDTGTEFEGRPAEWGEERLAEWTEVHYHQPSDELTADWSFEGMIQDARMGFLSGLILAEMEGLVEWVPGDEFEAARKEALAALGE